MRMTTPIRSVITFPQFWLALMLRWATRKTLGMCYVCIRVRWSVQKNPSYFDDLIKKIVKLSIMIFLLMISNDTEISLTPSVIQLRGLYSCFRYTHYSLLATVEDNWDLGNLGRNDATAQTFIDVYVE